MNVVDVVADLLALELVYQPHMVMGT